MFEARVGGDMYRRGAVGVKIGLTGFLVEL